jgi:hypothetical protein
VRVGALHGRYRLRTNLTQLGWDTRAGTIEVAIPKLRAGSYFPDWLLERRRRAEQALVTLPGAASDGGEEPKAPLRGRMAGWRSVPALRPAPCPIRPLILEGAPSGGGGDEQLTPPLPDESARGDIDDRDSHARTERRAEILDV